MLWYSCSRKAGGIFVNRGMEALLNRRLNGSLFGHPDVIKGMVDAFEKEVSSPLQIIGDRAQL
jgi:hypothetical protein